MMPRPGQNQNDPEFQKTLHLWKQQNNISDQPAASTVPDNVQAAWNNFTNPPAGTGGLKPTREMAQQFEQYGLNNNASTPNTQTVKSDAAPLPKRSAYKGYGDFINLPPGAIVDMRFVDRDRDGIDDRYQAGPGKPSGGGPKTKPKRKRELGRKTTPLGYLAANNLSAEKTNIGGMPR